MSPPPPPSEERKLLVFANLVPGDTYRLSQQICDYPAFLDSVSDLDWSLPSTDHGISPANVRTHLESLDVAHIHLARRVLEKTLYVSWQEFAVQMDACITTLLATHRAFHVHLYHHKASRVGSDHWLLAYVWNRIKDRVVDIVHDPVAAAGGGDGLPIVIIDDCMYSGTRMFNMFDGRDIPRGAAYVFVSPYCSCVARDLVRGLLGGDSCNIIYARSVPVVVSWLLWHKRRSCAVYFDHKIAGRISSFPDIYGACSKRPPDRSQIKRIHRLLERHIAAS